MKFSTLCRKIRQTARDKSNASQSYIKCSKDCKYTAKFDLFFNKEFTPSTVVKHQPTCQTNIIHGGTEADK